MQNEHSANLEIGKEQWEKSSMSKYYEQSSPKISHFITTHHQIISIEANSTNLRDMLLHLKIYQSDGQTIY